MNTKIRIQSILDRYPEVENLLGMYQVDLNEETMVLNIEELCELFGIDVEDLIMDLEDAIQDSRQAEWLANGGDDEDQWTENFTEEYDSTVQGSGTNQNDDGFEESEENYDDDY